MLQFDPRDKGHRQVTVSDSVTAVQKLNDVLPENCLQHLWGISPLPPAASHEVEVITSPSLHDLANDIVFHKGSMHIGDLQNAISQELVTFIESETGQQSDSTLWHALHFGRLTSSLFGEIYKAKKPNSLINRLLSSKLVL